MDERSVVVLSVDLNILLLVTRGRITAFFSFNINPQSCLRAQSTDFWQPDIVRFRCLSFFITRFTAYQCYSQP